MITNKHFLVKSENNKFINKKKAIPKAHSALQAYRN